MTLKTKTQLQTYLDQYFSDNTGDEASLLEFLRDLKDSASGLIEPPLTISASTTLGSEHTGRNILVDAAATLTLPEVATEDLPDGWYCKVKRATADAVTFAKEGTDVLEYTGASASIANENGWVTVHKDSDGVYSLIGDL